MEFPKYFDDACNEIDATLFSGDLMFDEYCRKKFNELLARWGRQMKTWESEAEELEAEENNVK